MRAAKQRPRATRSALAAAIFLVVLLGPFARVALRMNQPGEVVPSRWVLQDFRDAIYYPVVSLLDGENPYDVGDHLSKYPVGQPCSPYSPHFLALHLPFGFLPHSVSQLVYFALSIGLTLVLAAGVLAMCGRRAAAPSVLFLASLILMSRPGNWNLLLGQSTLELVLAVYAALWFASVSPWLAGAALAVAAMKPTFGIPLALMMLCRRSYRSVAIGVCIALITALGPTLALVNASGGFQSFSDSLWASFLTVDSETTSSSVLSAFRLDTAAFVSRLLGTPMGPAAEAAVFLLVMTICCMALTRLKHAADGQGAERFSIALISVAIVIASYQQTYSALLLVFPLASLIFGDWAPDELNPGRTSRILLIILLSIPMVNYLASWRIINIFEVGSGGWLLLTSINPGALLTAFVIYTGLAFRIPIRDRMGGHHLHPSKHAGDP